MTKIFSKKTIGALLAGLLLSSATLADLLVIVHPENTNKIDPKFVKSLYLGKVSRFANGDAATPIMLGDKNPLTELFLKEIVKQKPVQFKRLWSKALFTGNGNPPEVIESQIDVVRQVMNNRDFVAFIDASEYTNDVRAVLRLKTK